ncbi:MAG: hypothetical protein MZW92_05225 [Comamonadaceae bacterium]|nr:hypothetical protein [Comamonadaceae bacterium]
MILLQRRRLPRRPSRRTSPWRCASSTPPRISGATTGVPFWTLVDLHARRHGPPARDCR